MEREYINVEHPDFIGGLKAMSYVQETRLESSPRVPEQALADEIRLPPVPLIVMPTQEPSEKEHMDTELLKSLLHSYFTIVKRTWPKKASLLPRPLCGLPILHSFTSSIQSIHDRNMKCSKYL